MSTDRHYKDMSNEFVDQIFPSAMAMEEDTHLIEKDMSSGASSHYNRNAGAKEIESESFHSAIRMKSSAERDTHNKDMSSGVYSHYKRNVSAKESDVHIFSSQPASVQVAQGLKRHTILEQNVIKEQHSFPFEAHNEWPLGPQGKTSGQSQSFWIPLNLSAEELHARGRPHFSERTAADIPAVRR